jgi:hypothetical protein
VYGKGAAIQFPGSEPAWTANFTMVGQDQLARFNIFAATHATSLGGSSGALNISNGETNSWEQIWSNITEYFGLTGTAPASKTAENHVHDASSIRFGPDWFESVKAKAADFEVVYGLQRNFVTNIAWEYLTFLLNLQIDRVLNIQKARDLGFLECSNTVTDFKKSWDHMQRAKIIPSMQYNGYSS